MNWVTNDTKAPQAFAASCFSYLRTQLRELEISQALRKMKHWYLIICQEHTQVAAPVADLTTQLSLGSRGHWRIFN